MTRVVVIVDIDADVRAYRQDSLVSDFLGRVRSGVTDGVAAALERDGNQPDVEVTEALVTDPTFEAVRIHSPYAPGVALKISG